MPSGSAAVTVFKPNLNVFKDATLKQNPQTILLGTYVDEYLAKPTLKLEMLVHEIRHALMGYFNTNILLDENTYYMRSGLQETFYSRNVNLKDEFTTKHQGTTLDEITNTFITEILVNRIISFKKHKIENASLKSYLNSIKTGQPDGKYRAIGYNSEVRLLYPLLLNEMFISLINQHQFDGEIGIIKEFINNNTNICNYDDLCQLLDDVYDGNGKYSLEIQNGNNDFINNHISKISQVKSIILDLRKNIEGESLVKKR